MSEPQSPWSVHANEFCLDKLLGELLLLVLLQLVGTLLEIIWLSEKHIAQVVCFLHDLIKVFLQSFLFSLLETF